MAVTLTDLIGEREGERERKSECSRKKRETERLNREDREGEY